MAIGDSLATPNLWVDGDTTFNDAIVGGAPRFISIPLRAGVSYSFIVTGTFFAFDPFLTLYDTLDNAQAVLLTDDNSFDAVTEPMITGFVCPVTGIYYLGCSSLGGDGNFYFLCYETSSGAALTYFKSKTTNKIENFFQMRSAKVTNKILNFNVIRTKLTSNTFNMKDVHKALTTNQFNINAVTKIIGSSEKFHVWTKKGYELFANGVLIGFFAEGVFTLTDIALPDGDYDIVVKPLGNFYRNVEIRQKLRINTYAGGSGVTELFPLINDLTSIIDNMQTYIAWTILPQMISNTTKIGLWFGATSGIVITGTPDVSISIGELLSFKYRFKQSVTQWVAVACYDGADRGTKSEIELVWSTTLPDAPDFQHIT